MTKRATRSIGTKIKIGSNFIGDLSSIASPSFTTEEIDVTTLDSEGGVREFIAGFTDPGEVPISGFFVPGDLGQAEFYEAMRAKDMKDFEIIYPAPLTASWGFQGYVSAFNVTSETEDAIGFEGTIRVSGVPELNFESSEGLSDLVVDGTGGTLSPAFDIDSSFYVFEGVTANSITVTATGVGQTIRLYVDGTYSQDLQSGQLSQPIPVGDKSRKLTIVASESGKAPVTYEVIVI